MQRCSEIVARLRVDIRTGQLPIGTVLRQDALSKRFQSSRMPVREALLLLAAEGLVRQERYRGATVVGPDETLRRDWIELRRVLQCRALGSAVPLMSPADLDGIEALFELLCSLANSTMEPARCTELEVALQLAFISTHPNRAMVMVLNDAIRGSTPPSHRLHGIPLLMLGAIVAHCRSRRPADAVSALRKYLEQLDGLSP